MPMWELYDSLNYEILVSSALQIHTGENKSRSISLTSSPSVLLSEYNFAGLFYLFEHIIHRIFEIMITIICKGYLNDI